MNIILHKNITSSSWKMGATVSQRLFSRMKTMMTGSPSLSTFLFYEKPYFYHHLKEDGQLIPFLLACFLVVSDSERKARVQGDSFSGVSGIKFIGK